MNKMLIIENCTDCQGCHLDSGMLKLHPDCPLADAPGPEDIRVVCDAIMYRADVEAYALAVAAAKRLLATLKGGE